MAETRKSEFVGDTFGDWTVVRKADTEGDRKRRWVVANAEGVEMTILQTGLNDLALAKRLANKAAATDAARIPVLAQDDSNVFENAFTLTEAEADLYQRLDKQIDEARREALISPLLLREAVASVALDGDTQSFPENPFADLGEGRCLDCEEGNHPDDNILGGLPLQITAIENQLTTVLREKTGNDSLSVALDTTPLLPLVGAPGLVITGSGVDLSEPVGLVSLSPDYRAKLISAMDNIVKARIALNSADMAIQEML